MQILTNPTVHTESEAPSGVIFLPEIETRWQERSPKVQELGSRCLACLAQREADSHPGLRRRFGEKLCAGQVVVRQTSETTDAVTTGWAKAMTDCREQLDGGGPMPAVQYLPPEDDARGRAEYIDLVK